MFYNLAKKISKSISNITNRGRLTEHNISESLRDIRIALLEADVALSVVKKFVLDVKNDSIGKKFNKSLTPGQEFIKIIRNRLIDTMGTINEKNENIFNLSVKPPAVFLVVGFQGMGKTTTVAKLAIFLKKIKKKKVLVTSIDLFRPAAIEQLNVLAKKAEVDFYSHYNAENDLVEIARNSLRYAEINAHDVLIIDTPGFLHSENKMMSMIKKVKSEVQATETLLIVDAMIGQEAINMITSFHTNLFISGIILTKVDSDSRGGIALSVRYETGILIKFIGTGEKLHDLEYFQSHKIADRILGMENIVSIIQDIEKKVDKVSIDAVKNTFVKNSEFNLYDFLEQIQQMNKIGNIEGILKRFTKNDTDNKTISSKINNKLLKKFVAIINSMTRKERMNPEIIKNSRKRRIALGSGVKVQDVNQLLKQFEQVKSLIKSIKKNGFSNMLKNVTTFLSKKFF